MKRVLRGCFFSGVMLSRMLFLAVMQHSAMMSMAQEVQPLRLYGLNYNNRQGPDWSPTKCKTRSQVVADLEVLSQITSRIRILSLTDCDQGENVLSVVQNELAGRLQVWLGVWVGNNQTTFTSELGELERLIEVGMLEGDAILGLTVGSEAVYRGDAKPKQVIQYKLKTKTLLTENGYGHLPVAICEVDETYRSYYRLFVNSDVIFINNFPFWGRSPIENAVDALVDDGLPPIFDMASKVLNEDKGTVGKSVILGETGWPSEGSNAAASIASGLSQAQYLRDLYCRVDREMGWPYFYFTGVDNTWRIEQDSIEDTVEGHFGIFYSNLTLKEHFADMKFSCPGDDSIIYRFRVETRSTPIFKQPVSEEFVSFSPPDLPSSACAANPGCVGLLGECCPAGNGMVLDCCNVQIPETLFTPPETSPVPFIQPTSVTAPSPSTQPTSVPTLSPFPTAGTVGSLALPIPYDDMSPSTAIPPAPPRHDPPGGPKDDPTILLFSPKDSSKAFKSSRTIPVLSRPIMLAASFVLAILGGVGF